MADPAVGAVITAWSAISPFGFGRAAFAAGVRNGGAKDRATAGAEGGDRAADVRGGAEGEDRAADVRGGAGGGDRVREVPGFVIEEALGKKGTFGMDRASALAVATVARLLGGDDDDGDGDGDGGVRPDADTAVVLGTTSGSNQTQVDFATASLTRRKPYFVEPAMMPFGLMNSAAAQCALWHGLTGANTTLADGPVSGLSTLAYGARLLAAGRASGVICGGVEELTPARRWLTPGEPDLGEGCAVLMLEPARVEKTNGGAAGVDAGDGTAGGGEAGGGRTVLAEIVAVDTRMCLDRDVTGAVAGSLRKLLADAGPAEVVAAATSTATAPDAGTAFAYDSEAEVAALREVVGPVPLIRPADLIGDTGAAGATFAMAALLATAPRPGLVIATASAPDGKIATVLLRLP